jgi:protoporphyrinogen oxidase
MWGRRIPIAGRAMNQYDFLIAGAGPCGIGAAWTLINEFPNQRFQMIDPGVHPGGCAASEVTPEGFVFDCGGHVLFPHQEFTEFRDMLESIGCEWNQSLPVRGVYLHGRLIPAPVQRNVHRLPASELLPILGDLLILRMRRWFPAASEDRLRERQESLEDFLKSEFGDQLTRRVMGPLNRKMWALAPSEMSSAWVKERSGSQLHNVPRVSVRRLVKQSLLKVDDPAWRSAASVRYPATGGTGSIWTKATAYLGLDQIRLRTEILEIEANRRTVLLGDGSRLKYSRLFSTIPLDVLLKRIVDCPDLQTLGLGLRKSSALLFGFGIRGRIPKRYSDVHTFQCPETHIPFWRVTIPSNVAPGNVPDSEYYSILCEISLPSVENITISDQLREQVVNGLCETGLLAKDSLIVSTFERALPHGYPLPFMGRDELLSIIHHKLLSIDIVSRGRFGGWRYEVSNQDHAFTQGVEAIKFLASGIPEKNYIPTRILN